MLRSLKNFEYLSYELKAGLYIAARADVGDDAAIGIVVRALDFGDGIDWRVLRYDRADVAEVVLHVVEILRRRLDGSLPRTWQRDKSVLFYVARAEVVGGGMHIVPRLATMFLV